MVKHEGEHEHADEEGLGVFGILAVSAIITIAQLTDQGIKVHQEEEELVVGAFYLPIGERTPQSRKAMAEAVPDMSQQDIFVRDQAVREIQQQTYQEEQELTPIEGTIFDKPPAQEEELIPIEGTIFDRTSISQPVETLLHI